MDELYRFHCSSIPSICPTLNVDDSNFLEDGTGSSSYHHHHHQYMYASEIHDHDHDHDHHHHHHHHHQGLMERSDLIKAQIANHPLYPTLLSSYIDCRKVGAPPEMASVLEEIGKENHPKCVSTEIGKDPELDHFMKSYCDALDKYKEELSKPFEEATNFLSSIGSQLTHLCNQTLPSTTYSNLISTATATASPSASAEWEGGVVELGGCGRVESGDHQDLKEMLMRKYSGFVSNLRKELLKKRKRGKLPKNAVAALFDWWNTHYRWPYPTEEEKSMLSEITGLDQKQINNWFINQRKRHWRPSEDMRLALMEGVAVNDNDDTTPVDASIYFDAHAGGDATSI